MTEDGKFTALELKQIVFRIVGPVQPVGCYETETDARRFENLEVLCKLVDELVVEIDHVGRNKDHYEASRKKAGKFADDFLRHTLGIKE